MKPLDSDLANLIEFRSLQPEDHNFIFNSWLESYRNEPMYRELANDAYYSYHHKIIENLLEEEHTLVCCSRDNPTFIVGYIVFGNYCPGIPIIHYLFVKHNFRKQGIGSSLVEKAIGEDKELIISHKRKGFTMLIKSLNVSTYFVPYLMFKGKL